MKIWAVMRKVNVRGQGFCIDLFDSEEKAKQFVDRIVAMSGEVEAWASAAGFHTKSADPNAPLSYRDFSIVEMGVR